ncbi:MAG: glycosyltransferase family 2 protein [Desulfobacteraceae bacterium]|nr:MAG: glycosyltransferase family 2 protein [Desulfobacteraceae bacterium]
MEKPPLVSLLVPMRNEAQYIRGCLESIFRQTYPFIEVLVFDGLSTDDSYKIVETLFAARPNCQLYSNEKIIQAAAWNQGIQLSKGEILGIVSAHAELAPDYVEELVETLFRTQADLVGGPTFSDSKGFTAETIAQALNSPFGVGNARFHYTTKEIEVDTVFMGACWRRVYEKIGGFDEGMVRNQDDELSYRLLKHGGRIICNPAIRSRYHSRPDLMSLWRQYYQYGLWKVRVLQKHPRQIRIRQFVPVVFVTALILSSIFAASFPFAGISLYLLICCYFLANIAASARIALTRGWKYFALLPAVFAVMHFSYGFGFLAGFVRFAGLWRTKPSV